MHFFLRVPRVLPPGPSGDAPFWGGVLWRRRPRITYKIQIYTSTGVVHITSGFFLAFLSGLLVIPLPPLPDIFLRRNLALFNLLCFFWHHVRAKLNKTRCASSTKCVLGKFAISAGHPTLVFPRARRPLPVTAGLTTTTVWTEPDRCPCV